MFAHSLHYLADCLIAETGRDPQYPCYTEDSFRRKVSKAARRDGQWQGRTPDPSDGLLRREWRRIVAQAGLTRRQHQIVVRRLAGWTYEEIGREFGHTKQGAESIWRQARQKMLRAYRADPYVGLAEVYRSELRRGRSSNVR